MNTGSRSWTSTCAGSPSRTRTAAASSSACARSARRIARRFRPRARRRRARFARKPTAKEEPDPLGRRTRKRRVLKGEGQAKATRIYGEAIAKDPDFYEFSRTLDAYRKSPRREDDARPALGLELMRLLVSRYRRAGSPEMIFATRAALLRTAPVALLLGLARERRVHGPLDRAGGREALRSGRGRRRAVGHPLAAALAHREPPEVRDHDRLQDGRRHDHPRLPPRHPVSPRSCRFGSPATRTSCR